ncbi:MAG: succinate dehydrogenase assembly factor 2 [Legionellales bacterium]|nr:succinate dehydrogenase assembly factor 2 [Legionellales bacterium]
MDLIDKKKLHWACRRGMWELDILLERFLMERFDKLTPLQQSAFVELLSCQDQELFEWFMQRRAPEEVHLQEMIHLVLENMP